MSNKTNHLIQALGLGTAIMLVAGNIIGSGVFKKIAPMSAELMNGALILLAWLTAGIISMLGAFCFASLATTTHEAGGQFTYLKNCYNDFTGFMYGWSFFTVISTASIASMSYVFAESVVSLFKIGSIFDSYSNINLFGIIYPFANLNVKLVAIFTLIFLAFFNIRGVKGGGLLNNIVTSAKIIGICALIVIGFVYGDSSNFSNSLTKELDFSLYLKLSAFFAAMLGAFWAYDGWVNITNMASEIKNPMKNVPLAIIFGTLLVMVLYTLVNYSYLLVLTPADFATIKLSNDGKIAAVEVATVALGAVGSVLISTLIMVSTFGSTQCSTMSAARVYYQMARLGYFFKAFEKVHPKYHTPYFSLAGQCVWSSILIISSTFDQLTDMLIFASFMFFALGAVAVIKLKRQNKISFTIGYPVVPALFLFFCVVIVVNSIYVRPFEAFSGLVLMSSGIPFYFYFKSKLKNA